jgi:acyl-coenzyme A thioesterase PaaI-like protein
VEYKVNFLAPAVGEEARARGRVTRAGRTLTVCSGEVLMRADGEEQVVATMLATMMAVRGHRERPEADDAPAARGGADGP